MMKNTRERRILTRWCDSLYYEMLILCNKMFVTYSALARKRDPHFQNEDGPLSAPVDILIPVVTKDLANLPLVVQSFRDHLRHAIGLIFVVGNDPAVERVAEEVGCRYVDENVVLPIKKSEVQFFARGKDRSGWIFQQLLKLYSDQLCGTDNILVADADTILIRPTRFLCDGKPILYYSDEFNITYYRNFEQLFGRKVRTVRSYVAHMMLFNREVLVRLRRHLEERSGKPWHQAIFDSLAKDHPVPFSEFECYANFLRQCQHVQPLVRYSHNLSLPTGVHPSDIPLLQSRYAAKYRSLSFHVYP